MRGKCGKVLYDNQFSAQAALRRALLDPGRTELRVYRCSRCRGWHTTSRPRGRL